MSQYDSTWSDGPAVTPEQAEYAKNRVHQLMQPLRDADVDQSMQGHLAWLADDLVVVYEYAILDNTWSQLEAQVTSRFEWVAAQLGTPRRRAVFGELLMNTGEGDVWAWVNRWPGLRPMDVGEDPNVVNAWDTGVFDPTVDSSTTSSSAATETVYSEYQSDEPSETVYTEYRED